MKVIKKKTIVKSSFVLVELIFSIVLFSIILIYTLNSTISLQKQNQKSYQNLLSIIKLESTKLFLSKHSFENISYSNHTLYYDDNILLSNISSYTQTKTDDIYNINICLDNTACQQWYIK